MPNFIPGGSAWTSIISFLLYGILNGASAINNEYVTSEWSACTAECFQTREVTCVTIQDGTSQVNIDDSKCIAEGLEKPDSTECCCFGGNCDQQINQGISTGLIWYGTLWGNCAGICGTGQEERVVTCFYEANSTAVEHEAICGEEPAETRECDTGIDCRPTTSSANLTNSGNVENNSNNDTITLTTSIVFIVLLIVLVVILVIMVILAKLRGNKDQNNPAVLIQRELHNRGAEEHSNDLVEIEEDPNENPFERPQILVREENTLEITSARDDDGSNTSVNVNDGNGQDENEIRPTHIKEASNGGKGSGGNRNAYQIEWKEIYNFSEKPLGNGRFGEVLKASLKWNDKEIDIVIKMVKENASDYDHDLFLKESKAIRNMEEHSNVIEFIGACLSERTIYIVFEYVALGSLLDYLKKHRRFSSATTTDQHLSDDKQIEFAHGIALGMEHISNNGFVHRHLAARNILLGENFVPKVTDFGFEREKAYEDVLSPDEEDGTIALRWMAPEYFDNKYSSKSDVWAFGILVWEIASLGENPYPGLKNNDLYCLVPYGHRMSPPIHCNEKLYNIMETCWKLKPEERPKFKDLREDLEDMGGKNELAGNNTSSKQENEHQVEIDYINWVSIDYEIKWNELSSKEEIGEGQFGKVYKAKLNRNNKKFYVAIKKAKSTEIKQNKNLEIFFNELDALKKMEKHTNIIEFIGVCLKEGIPYIVLEYASKGDLLEYLRLQKSKNNPIAFENMIMMAHGIASGMNHIAIKGFIHRDLAARNILLDEDLVPKVADFGLTRDQDYFIKNECKNLLPIKWMAPENFTNKYTSKSDVWSFGILLWEIATLGDHPYQDIDSNKLMILLQNEYRLPKPENCKDDLYNIMEECWVKEPEERPEFKDLCLMFKKIESGSSGTIASVTADITKEYQGLILNDYDISWKELEFYELDELSEKSAGKVRKAKFNRNNSVSNVVIKTVKRKPKKRNIKLFGEEIYALKKLSKHSNITELYGACLENETIYIVWERAENGSLLDYLRNIYSPSNLSFETMIKIAYDICLGMKHITTNCIIHRNLAARNVLLGEDFVPKITDIGITREKNITKISDDASPIRWQAVECFTFNSEYSSKSDVWAFGILIWEIVTLGKTPYEKVKSQDLKTHIVIRENRLLKPPDCEDKLYKIMETCWFKDSKNRPDFGDLCTIFKEYLEHIH